MSNPICYILYILCRFRYANVFLHQVTNEIAPGYQRIVNRFVTHHSVSVYFDLTYQIL
jgi:hypothetical protein